MFRKLASIVLLCAVATAHAEERLPLSSYARGTVRIETASGRIQPFEVYLARSDRERMQGLMYVESLPAGEGMLFEMAPPRPAAMWMKNTLIPLDLIFIRSDGTIANIVADAAPETLESRRSDGPIAWVLELNGGTAARLSIVPGARVHIDTGKH
jgi:uncharacterized membrane protein (UPF0127 family)